MDRSNFHRILTGKQKVTIDFLNKFDRIFDKDLQSETPNQNDYANKSLQWKTGERSSEYYDLLRIMENNFEEILKSLNVIVLNQEMLLERLPRQEKMGRQQNSPKEEKTLKGKSQEKGQKNSPGDPGL